VTAMYSFNIDDKEKELHAFARVEGVNASYKDLTEVCGRIRGKPVAWAVQFLEGVREGKQPVLYKRHAKRLGHRRALGGRKGRYPQKAARVVLKVLKSAMANGTVKGLDEEMLIRHASANKKHTYGRLAPKGRRKQSAYETARVEIVLKSKGRKIEKKVEVKPPAAKEEKSKEKAAAEKPPERKTKEEKVETPGEKKSTDTKPAATATKKG